MKKHRTPHLFPSREGRALTALDRSGVPSVRDIGSLSITIDTQEWVKGRPEQLSVYYAVPATGLPLLGLERSHRFTTGLRGKQNKVRPAEYRPVSLPWAYNLADNTHVHALVTSLRALRDFHYHKDDLIKQGLRVPEPWSADASEEVTELLRTSISTEWLADEAGEAPTEAYHVIDLATTRMAGTSSHDGLKWTVRLRLEGRFGEGVRPVRFMDGAYVALIRDACIPALLTAVEKLVLVSVPRMLRGATRRTSHLMKGSRKRRSIIKRIARTGTATKSSYVSEDDTTKLLAYKARKQAWVRAVRPLGVTAAVKHINQSSACAEWVDQDVKDILVVGKTKRRSRKAGVLEIGFGAVYFKRLLAYSEGLIQWSPTYGVSEEKARRDIARVKARYAAYWMMLLTAAAVLTLPRTIAAPGQRMTHPVELVVGGERRRETTSGSSCARAPPLNTS